MTWSARIFRFSRIALPLIVLALPAGTAIAGQTDRETARFRQICVSAVAGAERRHAIPDKLLTAISHAESGRWDAASQASFAWPWTVTAEGTGHYLPSRAAAIARVKALRARGITNIDVGCMQVNLHYHPDAFATLAAAFDPATNAAYAGSFLRALKRETGSWRAATARYHSATQKFAVPYSARVMRLWQAARAAAASDSDSTAKPTAHARTANDDSANDDTANDDTVARQRAAAAHRQAIVAAYLARRAARYAATAPQRVASADVTSADVATAD